MKEFLECHKLEDGNTLWVGDLPGELILDEKQFEELWQLHPDNFHEIKMHGRLVKTPRWQQAYGQSYHYTGRVNHALPTPTFLSPFLKWVKENIHPELNGILVNWYDGKQKHYIGKHRDSTKNMVEGAPIVTLSFGEERIFRLRPWRGKGFIDFKAENGRVFVMPYATNQAWTHEVPTSGYEKRRVSVTIRAFS